MTVERLVTPIGRLVWGHPMKPKDKTNYTTKQPVLDDQGQKIPQWSFGVAIPKAEFQEKVWPYMAQEAATAYPNQQPRDFSWKYTDGDGVDDKGKPYSDREGYAGCYILNISTEAFQPPVWKWDQSLNNGQGDYKALQEHEIKCGDYVCVNLNMKVHTNNSGGLYMNPNGVELVGYGTEIVSTGANATELFGGAPQHQLPPGASATPISSAPAGSQMPGTEQQAPQGMPGQQPMQQQPGGMPQGAPAGQPMQQQQPMGNAPQGAPSQQPASPADANQLPPPANNFVANAQGMPQGAPAGQPMQQQQYQQPMGNGAPTAAPMQQPGQQPQTAPGTAQTATTYPSNTPPGMPAR